MQAESNMIIQGERPQSHIVATQCAYKSVKLHILRATTKPEEVIKNIDCSRRRRRSHDSQTHSREAGLQDCSDASTGQYWQILQFTVKNRYACMQIASEHTHTQSDLFKRCVYVSVSTMPCLQESWCLVCFYTKSLNFFGKMHDSCMTNEARHWWGNTVNCHMIGLLTRTWKMYPMTVEDNESVHFKRVKWKTARAANGASSVLFCISGLAPVFQTENNKNAALFSPLRRWPIIFLFVCVNTKLSFSEWWNAARKQGREM